ncbi:DUF1294 domain-containing protein [Vibrio tritonius]|uniref:DUF1294 domain-containing protein n=1 Tax=Vibrio tritonius TaxID=1435069 RepID=UPI00315D76A4
MFSLNGLVSLLFFVLVGAVTYWFEQPYWVLLGYAVLSVITFFCYFKDKRAAKRDDWRVQEKTLHLLALLGGWPGALLGQKVFRHKTQKQPFKSILWLTVIVNIGCYVVLVTPMGREWLASYW